MRPPRKAGSPDICCGRSEGIGTLDVGLTCMIGKTAQIDTGVNFGLTPAADDHDLFFGVSFRY